LQRENPTDGVANVTERRVAHSPLRLSTSRWFALLTRSRHEFAARDALRAHGTEAFLPTWRETVAWTDRKTVTERPLFTGYLFARFDPAVHGAILATRGVVRILSLDQKPVPISDDVIEDLQRIVLSPVACSPCAYVAGDQVTVRRGPFAGVTGVISRVKGATTLTIPVEILGRAVSVQIDAADVAAGE